MKNKTEYKVFYVNEETGDQVPFRHCTPMRFDKEEATQFIKEVNFDRWYGNGSTLPKSWKMKALPITEKHQEW